MDSWEMQMERAKADARRPFYDKHPHLTVALVLCVAAVLIFGCVLAYRAFHP